MKSYFIMGAHSGEDQPRDVIAISDNFSWGAALMAPLWFLWRGMWLHACLATIVIAAFVATGFQISQPELVFLSAIAICLWLGFEARFLYMEYLISRGFETKKMLLAKSTEFAELIYLGSLTHIHPLQEPIVTVPTSGTSSDIIFSRNWDS